MSLSTNENNIAFLLKNSCISGKNCCPKELDFVQCTLIRNTLIRMDMWEFEDDDEEILSYLNRPIATRHFFPRSRLFEDFSDNEFLRRFRLSKSTTMILLQQIDSHLTYSADRMTAITPINQLLCTLRFYATGSQLITCGDMIGVHESTACRIVHRVTHAIASLAHSVIQFPNSEDQLNEVATGLFKIAKFPRVVGVIDCTHVRIISPGGENAEIYRNRKGYFSINTQCVAAADLKFLDVVARWHGSAHDSNIWDNCALKRNFLQGKYHSKFLLGDSGYAQTKYMMVPLPDRSPCTRGENLYQESQIKTRNVIERAFGIWKRRLPILSRGINIQLHKVPGIIMATAVLHNFAISQNEDVPPEDSEYPLIEEISLINTISTQQQQGGVRNLDRTILIENYFTSL